MSGSGFDEPTRQIITGTLAAAVASAAASRIDDPIDPIRHIAFYLLPNDDMQAVFRVGRGAVQSSPRTGRVLLCAPLSAQLVAVRHRAVAALPNVTSMSFGPSAAMVLVQVRARPALLNDRAAQNHRAGARRSAQSLRVDVHGGLTTVSAFRSFPAAAPPDPSSCARRGRWASADAAGPLHDPTGRAGLDCSSSKSKSARSAVTPGVSGVERAPAAGLHGTCMSTTRCLAMWLS